jgi:RNA polymerase sigma factor (sigma-70 family)
MLATGLSVLAGLFHMTLSAGRINTGNETCPVPPETPMSNPPLFRYLIASADPGEGVTDANLARRYADSRDQASFELLVRRHADAVWAACRRILPKDQHLAEDAFQATFLALTRKAGSIRGPCFSGWLYRVAIHAAVKARDKAGLTRPNAEDDPPAPEIDPDRAELCSLVHEELAALNEKYRLPIVLCDLSGLNHADAAARLGWPIGTVSGRLSLARDQLRSRLRRRGINAPTVLIASFAGVSTVSASLIRAVVSFVAGGPVPLAVVSLTEGVLSTMKWTQLKLIAFVLTAVVTVTVTTAVALTQQQGGKSQTPTATAKPAAADVDTAAWNTLPPPSAFPEIQAGMPLPGVTPVKVLADDTSLRKLQKARFNVLLREFEVATQSVRAGALPDSELRQFHAKLAAAAAEVFDRPADLRPWVEAWVGAMKAEEGKAERAHLAFSISMADLLAARRARIEAEIALAKLPPK